MTTNRCAICLLSSTAGYHPDCLQTLLGIQSVPELPFKLDDLYSLATQTVGHTSISGAQSKISVNLALQPGSSALYQVVAATRESPGRFILKPQSQHYAALPENEHLTMSLARLGGIETADCGLFFLKDGSAAYLVRRFDRTATGAKLFQEDLCQLARMISEKKYEGSAELCARLLRKHAADPPATLRLLYRQMVFAFLCGNGDLHLKNLSVQRLPEKGVVLSPAYDLVSTQLCIPNDKLALTIDGKRTGLTRRTFLNFADYCEISRETATEILGELADLPAQAGVRDRILRSFLPEKDKAHYQELLEKRARILCPR